MEQNQALYKLLEAAALAGMIEDLASPGSLEKLSPTSISGLRITLRSIRDTILASHAALSGTGIRAAGENTAHIEANPAPAQIAHQPHELTQEEEISPQSLASKIQTEREVSNTERLSTLRQHLMADPERMQMRRRDLRASLDGIVDRSSS